MQQIVVTPHFWSDVGVGNAVRQLTKELAKLGVDLVGVIHGDSYAKNMDEPVPATCVGIKDSLVIRPFKELLLSRRAANSLKLLQNDCKDDCVIHSHSLYPSAILRDGDKVRDANFVTTVHGVNPREIERFRKETLMHPQEIRYRLIHYVAGYERAALIRRSQGHFIALSPENARILVKLGQPQSKVHLIPNGVDLSFFRPHDCDEARKKLGLPTEKLIVSTISTIDPRKGLHTLIKAARTVINEEPDAYFVVVGRVVHGWYLAYLKQLLNKLQLNKHFRFMGFVPREDLPLYMNAADIFVLASTAEGAPLVVPQAMACRRLVIATETAAAGYLPTTLVVQNGNSEDLAQTISFYLSNTKDRKLMGEELYTKAIRELSWTNIARKTLDLYRKIA